MTKARIFRPSKSAMQSGRATSATWVLEFEPASARQIEPLMGWTGTADAKSQVRLRFGRREDAVAYAVRHGIPYRLFEPHETRTRIKAYADNFK